MGHEAQICFVVGGWACGNGQVNLLTRAQLKGTLRVKTTNHKNVLIGKLARCGFFAIGRRRTFRPCLNETTMNGAILPGGHARPTS